MDGMKISQLDNWPLAERERDGVGAALRRKATPMLSMEKDACCSAPE
jgi:hypothetical protein